MRSVLLLLGLALLAPMLHAQRDLEAHMDQAMKAIDEKDYAGGIRYANKALEYKKDAGNSYKVAKLYLTRGYCKFQLKKYQDAEKDFNQALQISPEFLKAFESKNLVYFATRQFDSVIANSKKALALSPRNTRFLLSSARASLLNFDYPKALLIADSILKIAEDDADALQIQAEVYYIQKNYKEALRIENHILSLKPNDCPTLLARGITYAKMGEYDKAMQDNELASKTDSSLRYVALNNIAFFIKMSNKDYEGALILLDQCLATNPDFAYAYSNISFCKLQLGDIPSALKNVQRSVELDPHNSYAYKNYALIRIRQQKPGEACKLLRTAEEKGYSKQYDDEVSQLLTSTCH